MIQKVKEFTTLQRKKGPKVNWIGKKIARKLYWD